MNPETVVQTIRAVAEATTETMRWLQTENGQKFLERSFAQQDQFAKNMKALGEWFEKLFTGRLQ